MIQIKRIYDPLGDDDGYRILVDRLWPRGITKEKAQVDLWMKEITPSPYLRKWFSHDPEKWDEFCKLYEIELKDKRSLIENVKELEKEHGIVTLLYAAKDTKHTHALILEKLLK